MSNAEKSALVVERRREEPQDRHVVLSERITTKRNGKPCEPWSVRGATNEAGSEAIKKRL